ncbi:DNA polymerase delta subunit 3 [Anaeramoeba flamelloides]|uniref:DNA polymerase delta subunit 3 n=1 Tax=Anaeramoeba flamelloides TaxID=1746091 RepID=A0ABQ8XHY5_9EUKA|nr:DNA polymerase delta subunit 3 [Anaeramoeba flamelloides]
MERQFQIISGKIFSNNENVTHRWVSENFFLPTNQAKDVLYKFYLQNKQRLAALFVIILLEGNNRKVRLVEGSDKESVNKQFSCSNAQIYSLQENIPQDLNKISENDHQTYKQLFLNKSDQSSEKKLNFFNNKWANIKFSGGKIVRNPQRKQTVSKTINQKPIKSNNTNNHFNKINQNQNTLKKVPMIKKEPTIKKQPRKQKTLESSLKKPQPTNKSQRKRKIFEDSGSESDEEQIKEETTVKQEVKKTRKLKNPPKMKKTQPTKRTPQRKTKKLVQKGIMSFFSSSKKK